MDLAGDIVQELCDFLRVNELSSTADFPHEFESLHVLLTMVCWTKCHWFEEPEISDSSHVITRAVCLSQHWTVQWPNDRLNTTIKPCFIWCIFVVSLKNLWPDLTLSALPGFFFNVAVVVPIINQSCWLSALSNLKNTLELLGTWMFRFHTGINIYMNVHVHCDFVCCYCVNIWWFCPTFICVVTRLLCEQNFCWNNCWCSCVVWWCLLVLKHSINISITYEFDLC